MRSGTGHIQCGIDLFTSRSPCLSKAWISATATAEDLRCVGDELASRDSLRNEIVRSPGNEGSLAEAVDGDDRAP